MDKVRSELALANAQELINVGSLSFSHYAFLDCSNHGCYIIENQ